MKKKILMIAPLPLPYHGASVVSNILLNSIKDDFSVFYVNTNSRKLFFRSKFLNLRRIAEVLMDFCLFIYFLFSKKVDFVYVVHSRSPLGFIKDSFYVLLSKLFRKKVVAHFHGALLKEFHNKHNFLLRFYSKMIFSVLDKVIVLDKTFKLALIDFVDLNKVVVIPNFVDSYLLPSNFEFSSKLRRIKKGRKLVVLFISNFIYEKGYFYLLKAAKQFKKDSSISFIFAGEWVNEADFRKVKKYISENKLTNVRFLSSVSRSKKRKLIKDADIFVLPTFHNYEGTPVSIIEAMSFGLTIITTRKGAIPSLIISGKNGFFVSPRSYGDIVSVIKYLKRRKGLLIRIAKLNNAKVLQNYSLDIFKKSFLDLFNSLSKL